MSHKLCTVSLLALLVSLPVSAFPGENTAGTSASSKGASIRTSANQTANTFAFQMNFEPLSFLGGGQRGLLVVGIVNLDSTAAPNVIFTQSFSGGSSYINSATWAIRTTGASGNCSISNSTVSCALGTMNPRDQAGIRTMVTELVPPRPIEVNCSLNVSPVTASGTIQGVFVPFTVRHP